MVWAAFARKEVIEREIPPAAVLVDSADVVKPYRFSFENKYTARVGSCPVSFGRLPDCSVAAI